MPTAKVMPLPSKEPASHAGAPMIDFQTSPDSYRHWRLEVNGPVATLIMDVREDGGLSEG